MARPLKEKRAFLGGYAIEVEVVNTNTGEKICFRRILLFRSNSVPVRFFKEKHFPIFLLTAHAEKRPVWLCVFSAQFPVLALPWSGAPERTWEDATYLSWPLLPEWAQSRHQRLAWREQPAGAWVPGLVSEEPVGEEQATCIRRMATLVTGSTLTGGHSWTSWF